MNFGDAYFLPVLYLVGGLAMFGVGGLHYFFANFKKIARIIRLSGIYAAMVALFLLTFRFFSGSYEGYSFRGMFVASDTLVTLFTVFAVLGVVALIINRLYNPSKSVIPDVEFYTVLVLIVLSVLFFNFPSDTNVYVILFNLVMAGMIFLLIQQGYFRLDMRVVDIGLFFFVIFVIARYFDFFWELLDRSVFFILGGLVLLAGGVILEKKRREIKAQLRHNQ